MALDIVRGNITNIQPTNELIECLQRELSNNDEGTLYLGYPLSANADSKNTVDALLITREKGIIAFKFSSENDIANLEEEQDNLYYILDFNFKKYTSLKKKKGRGLAFEPVVITWLPEGEIHKSESGDYIFANSRNIAEILNNIEGLERDIYVLLNEALDKVSNIKPRKKRANVSNDKSKGGIIKQIEKEIANLDRWQKKAALEIPEGPQRIRGLAGSGKTIVLALKAAYLHSQYPNWNIAVTFYTRSLQQQYKELIRQFSFEFSNEEPDWDKIKILHAWGTNQEHGIYSIAASDCNVIPLNYNNARLRYGRSGAFEGACSELIGSYKNEIKDNFDAILIDEAQDLPMSFFKICYQMVKNPKRIIWAYDELQNLGEAAMPSLEEMFGIDESGNLNINLESKSDEAKRDIILPVCYRNPPWTLSLAHALGFGIYRETSKVQMFNEFHIWEDIGYKVEAGRLAYGENVKLVRKIEASPKYFYDLIDIDDSIIYKKFDDANAQYKWVADQIHKDINKDELDPDDILVIFPDAYYSKSEYTEFRKYLLSKGIDSILAGINTDKDVFRVTDKISCSGIYRAKGNEAPMVYIVNSQHCAAGAELIKLRNILFTAITRSRAWVRICGVGNMMELLNKEIDECARVNDFNLNFKMPTQEELVSMRKLHKEKTVEETKKIKNLKIQVNNIIESIEGGEIDPEYIPELESLLNIYKQSKFGNDNDE
ncbi:DEAD/DEAH box helicase [Intestinibacter bartlettii]|uniref:DEAD/DEAH box helicase n=1 Tax=Intestinibacter bartlettii TaxID=261299 RepID=UPI003522D462